MHIAGQRPRYDTEVCFTVHEEVGHGVKQMSDEKISDLKRAENKRGGGYSRKGPRNN